MADLVVDQFNITPNYNQGFTFAWGVRPGHADPGPWVFTIEESRTVDGPWEPLTPELENLYGYTETLRRLVPKSRVLNYRVVMVTPTDTYYSHPITPYRQLARRDTILAKEILRREVQQMRGMSGVCVRLRIKSRTGPVCPTCVDPITGGVPDPHCPDCLGTGRSPGYHGPYDTIGTWSPYKQDAKMSADQTGLRDERAFKVRMLATLPVENDDILEDPGLGKRYYVHGVSALVELRRVPLVFDVVVRESPVTSPAYGAADVASVQSEDPQVVGGAPA